MDERRPFGRPELRGLGDLLLPGRVGLAGEAVAQLFHLRVARPAIEGLVAGRVEIAASKTKNVGPWRLPQSTGTTQRSSNAVSMACSTDAEKPGPGKVVRRLTVMRRRRPALAPCAACAIPRSAAAR